MSVSADGQELQVGDEVCIRARIEEMTGDVLHLRTLVPTPAYPEGTRVNLLSGQVEKLESDETEKPPLQGDGTESQSQAEEPAAEEANKGGKNKKRK